MLDPACRSFLRAKTPLRWHSIFASKLYLQKHADSGLFSNARRVKHLNVNLQGSSKAIEALLSRRWLLARPDSCCQRVKLARRATSQPSTYLHSLYVLRDDLLHPLYGGNKARKLDALLPELSSRGVTHVVTYGGLQSAHTAAVAAACAEQGLAAHLLLRGEPPPKGPAGNFLVSRLYGQVTHVSRGDYADRQGMVQQYCKTLASTLPATAQVEVIHEGAASATALLGLIRLVHFLSQPSLVDSEGQSLARLQQQPCTLLVDSGTGVTATGIALGIKLLGLPWTVLGIMLAGSEAYYHEQQHTLAAKFSDSYLTGTAGPELNVLPLKWVPRVKERTFGKVLPGELLQCKQIAQQHGILLDPIYTMASWEKACQLLDEPERQGPVIMLHTGGLLGWQGLAQRFPNDF